MKYLFLVVLLSSCVTYNKCYEKFGMTKDTKPQVGTLALDTLLQGTVNADSVDGFIDLDTLCDSWKKETERGFNNLLTDTLKVVSTSGKLMTQHWIDKYNRLLKFKSKKEIDTVYVPYHDTLKVTVNCPQSVWFDPLDKLPWYAPAKLWHSFQLFATWTLIVAVIALIIYLIVRPSKNRSGVCGEE